MSIKRAISAPIIYPVEFVISTGLAVDSAIVKYI
jgi:hypothetical protein